MPTSCTINRASDNPCPNDAVAHIEVDASGTDPADAWDVCTPHSSSLLYELAEHYRSFHVTPIAQEVPGEAPAP